MNVKKIIALLMLMFLLSLAFVSVAKAETRLVWKSPLDWKGIDVKIYTSYQAYPGDNITIRVKVEATENLNDTYVAIKIYGSKLEGYDSWITYINILSGENLLIGEVDQNFTLNIPPDVSPGSIYGHIYCLWNILLPVPRGYSQEDSFEVTYLKSRELEQLQAAYNELNATYNSLLGNYTELESKHKGEVSSARNLMYVFVGTTLVSAATVIVLLIRRPKRLWS